MVGITLIKSTLSNMVNLEGFNAQSFEDYEKTVPELKAYVLKSLYFWMVAFNSSCFSNFQELMKVCSSSPP